MTCIKHINASSFEKIAKPIGSVMRQLMAGVKRVAGKEEARLLKSRIESELQSRTLYGADSRQSRRKRVQS